MQIPLDHHDHVPGDAEVAALLERTLRRSRTGRRRRLGMAIAIVLVAASVGIATTVTRAGPAAARRGTTTWQLVADVTSQFAASDVTFSGVSLVCTTSTSCVVVGHVDDGLVLEVTTDAGASWATSTPPGTVNSTSITCPMATTCAALAKTATGSAMVETTDLGATWTSVPFPGEAFTTASTLSCTTALDCVAVALSADGTASSYATTDGGATWTTSALPIGSIPPAALEVTGLSCHGASCTLLASAMAQGPSSSGYVALALTSDDAGSTWSTGTVPSGFDPGYDVSCATALDCMAVGTGADGAPAVIATADGGATWTTTTEPVSADAGSAFLNWDSCTQTSCWVSGGALAASQSGGSSGFLDETTDLGATWGATSLPQGVTSIGNVACVDASTCYALGAKAQDSGPSTLVLLTNAAG